MFWATEPYWAYLEHPFLSLFRLKEPERRWKSDMRTLSWKSGWKLSKRREFWHQRISDIFFLLEVVAVWSWNFSNCQNLAYPPCPPRQQWSAFGFTPPHQQWLAFAIPPLPPPAADEICDASKVFPSKFIFSIAELGWNSGVWRVGRLGTQGLRWRGFEFMLKYTEVFVLPAACFIIFFYNLSFFGQT